MARYAGIIANDYSASPGISTTFFVQGCPHHCPMCHNYETWDFNGGKEVTKETYQELYDLITANGITRNLAIMGGEPLCPENVELTWSIIKYIKQRIPNIKVYLYTGYYVSDFVRVYNDRTTLEKVLANIEWLIDGPYIDSARDVTLCYRGSTNQRIIQGPLTFGKKFDILNIDDDEKIRGGHYGSTDFNN